MITLISRTSLRVWQRDRNYECGSSDADLRATISLPKIHCEAHHRHSQPRRCSRYCRWYHLLVAILTTTIETDTSVGYTLIFTSNAPICRLVSPQDRQARSVTLRTISRAVEVSVPKLPAVFALSLSSRASNDFAIYVAPASFEGSIWLSMSKSGIPSWKLWRDCTTLRAKVAIRSWLVCRAVMCNARIGWGWGTKFWAGHNRPRLVLARRQYACAGTVVSHLIVDESLYARTFVYITHYPRGWYRIRSRDFLACVLRSSSQHLVQSNWCDPH